MSLKRQKTPPFLCCGFIQKMVLWKKLFLKGEKKYMKLKTLISLIGTYSSVVTPPSGTGGIPKPYVTVDGDTITIHTAYTRTFKTNSSHATYDADRNIIRVYGNKYRVWMVEKNYVAEIDVSSLSYHLNQIIGLYTSYTNPNGMSHLSISTTKGFSENYSISYTKEITIGLASTITLGIEGIGLSATNNTEAIAKQSFSSTYGYSLTYSNSVTKNITVELKKIPENCLVSYGIAANILKGKVTTYVEEHWFYGIYKSEYSENNDFEYLADMRDTLVAKNKNTGAEFAYE